MTIPQVLEAYRQGRMSSAECMAAILALVAQSNHPKHNMPWNAHNRPQNDATQYPAP
jgi:hypothetical protein